MTDTDADKGQYPYRESAAFRASRAKTARKQYWKDPEKIRQQRREARRRKKLEFARGGTADLDV
jgi:hypothetical protein